MKLVKRLKNAAIFLIVMLLICGCLALYFNDFVKSSVDEYILPHEDAAYLTDVDCILVLGCQVKDDGIPSHMLEDRIKRGIALYEDGAAPKLLMSGDHGRTNYNEVGTMKAIAIEAGIPSEDIFMDHAGFSTYESLWRAKEIFGAKKVIIVSQKYHLYRALYIAERLGVEAYGVDTDYRSYSGQTMRDIREIAARCKDVFTTAFKTPPTYGGEAIPISGSGDLTNDYNENNEK